MEHEEFEVEVHGKFDIIPKRMEEGSVGYDIALPEEEGDLVLPNNCRRVIDTGIIIKPPSTCFELVVPRSSVYNKNVRISNTVGVIDPSYCGRDDTIKASLERGPVQYKFDRAFDMDDHSISDVVQDLDRDCKYGIDQDDEEFHLFVRQEDDPVVYRAGERFCQVVFLPFHRPELVEKHLDEFGDNRGGMGSTGEK